MPRLLLHASVGMGHLRAATALARALGSIPGAEAVVATHFLPLEVLAPLVLLNGSGIAVQRVRAVAEELLARRLLAGAAAALGRPWAAPHIAADLLADLRHIPQAISARRQALALA